MAAAMLETSVTMQTEVRLMSPATVNQVAELCHNANRAYCESMGDHSQVPWSEAPEWQKDSARNVVLFHMNNETTPAQSHESWMQQKVAEGWTYGPVKDPVLKQHPCMVPYEQLPAEQKAKDYIFKAICDTFKAWQAAGSI